jgi:hypothetical protein
MKKFTLLASLLMFITMTYAVNVIPVGDAMQASKNFLSERVGAMKASQMELVLTNTEYSMEGTPVTYRFSVGDKGFIIVSATDLANPILAFSLESDFQEGTGADIYTKRYAKEMAYLMENPSAALNVRNSWNHYLATDFTPYNASKGNPCVEPLITTRWTQEQYYNTMCPYNPQNSYNDDYHTPVGCVALTMANILYYYRYPEHGYGAVSYLPHEYDDEGNLTYTYPFQIVNYSQANYNYDAMANSLSAYDGELAKLIYHCGVSVRMSYGWDGSGSQSEYALAALQDHYYFNRDAQFKEMEDVSGGIDSLTYLWVNIAKEELDQHRPLFFSGRSQAAGGHAWIVDGYITINNATYFHVNWGWAGGSNGYYLINNQVSSGYGNFNYENDNSMMVKLMPDSAAIEKPAESSKRVTASFGTISDGAGNMKYAPNSNRRWVLACPDATSYELKFSKLKVKNGDKVTVYNGGTEASGVKKEYSGSYLMAACNDYQNLGDAIHADYQGEALPAALTVNADSVLVVFTSNADSEIDYGFVLDYSVKSYDKSACSDKTFTDQYNVLTDKPNNATGDDTYRASNVCEYTLNLKFTDQLVYAFHKFDLKQGDFVDIYNQTSPNSASRVLVAHYDINNPPTSVYTYNTSLFNISGVPSSKFIIRFASDNLYQGTGFELEYYGQITNINEFDNTEVKVYPNPATSFVNVDVTSEEVQQFNVKMVDMMGKTVYVDQFISGTDPYTINVNNFAKGVYFLHLNSENGHMVQKIVVK